MICWQIHLPWLMLLSKKQEQRCLFQQTHHMAGQATPRNISVSSRQAKIRVYLIGNFPGMEKLERHVRVLYWGTFFFWKAWRGFPFFPSSRLEGMGESWKTTSQDFKVPEESSKILNEMQVCANCSPQEPIEPLPGGEVQQLTIPKLCHQGCIWGIQQRYCN